MSQSNDSGLNLDHLEALARAAMPGTQIDQPDQCDAEAALKIAAKPAAVLELIALARRAALANQPAPTVPADAMSQFAAWKGYELPALNSDGHFDKDWLHREWRAFQAGMARAAHQPAQEQAEQYEVWNFAHEQWESTDKNGYLAAHEKNRRAAQQEPVAAPQEAAAPSNSVEFDGIKTRAPGTPEAPADKRWEYRGFYIVQHASGAAITGTYNNTRHPDRTHFVSMAQAMGYIDCYLDERAAQLDGGQEGSELNG